MVIKRLSILVIVFIGLQSIGLYPFEQTNNGVQLVATDYSKKPHETIISTENYTQPILAGKLVQYGYRPLRLQIRNMSEKTLVITPQDINIPIINPDVIARTFHRGYILSPFAKGFGWVMISKIMVSFIGISMVNRQGKLYGDIKDFYQKLFSAIHDGEKLQKEVEEKQKLYEKASETFKAAHNPPFLGLEKLQKEKMDFLQALSELDGTIAELNKINDLADHTAYTLVDVMQMCIVSIFPAAYYAWNTYHYNKQLTQIFADALFHSACEIKPKQTTDLLIFVDKNTDLSQFMVQTKDIQGMVISSFSVKL